MSDYILGGASRVEIYTLTTGHAFDTLDYVFEDIVDSDFAPDDKRVMTITLNQEADEEELDALFADALPTPADGASLQPEPERVMENGRTRGGTAPNAVMKGCIAYGGVGKISGKRKIFQGIVAFDPTSGAYKQANNAPTSPKVVMKTVPQDANHTVPAAKYSTDLVTTPTGATTIPKVPGWIINRITAA